MRRPIFFCLITGFTVVTCAAQVAISQPDSLTPEPDVGANRIPDPKSSVEPAVDEIVEDQIEGSAADRLTDVAGEWTPAFRIALNTTSTGETVQETKTVMLPYRQLVLEPVSTDTGISQKPVSTIGYRKSKIVVTRPGKATLFCDAIKMDLGKQENAVEYGFECEGRLHLRIGVMAIDADSGRLSEGQLSLVNARIVNGGTTFSADVLTLNLDLHGLSTATHNLPITELLPLEESDDSGKSKTRDPSPDPLFFSPSGDEFKPSQENGEFKRSSLRRGSRRFIGA